MIAFFRQWAKGFIWFIVIAFLLATFLGSASIFFLLNENDRERAAARPPTAAPADGEEARPKNPLLDSNEPAARVELDGEAAVITEGDVEKRLNQQELVRGQVLPEDARKFWRPIVLENMVDEKLVLLRAKALNLDVASEVEKQLAQIFSQVGKDEYLTRTGQTEAEVRGLLEERIKYERMLGQVREGRTVSEEEAKAYYQANLAAYTAEGAAEPRPFDEVRDEVERAVRANVTDDHVAEYYDTHKIRWKKPRKVRLLHAAFDLRSAARLEASTPTPEEVQAYYEEHLDDYRERPTVDFAHIFLDPNHPDFAEKARPTEDQIQAYYDLNRDEFEGEEQVRLSQILLEGEDAEDKADRVMARLRKGEPFAAVAKTQSADRATAAKGGDMGFVAALDLAEELADLAFSLEQGRITDPIRVGQSYHILHIGETKAGVLKPLAEVRDVIVKDLVGRKTWEFAEAEAKKVHELAAAEGADFAALAREHSHAGSAGHGGEVGTVILGENEKSTVLDEVGTEGFLDFAIQRALREAEVGSIPDPVRSFKGFHVLHVRAKPEPKARPLDEVREVVARAARKDKADRAVDALVEEARALAAGPEAADPAALAKKFLAFARQKSESADLEENGGDWGPVYLDTTTPPEVPNAVRAEVISWNGLSRRVVDAVKDLDPGEITGGIDLSGKRHVFMVAEELPAEFEEIEEVEDEIRQALYPHVTEEEMREYFEENKAEFDKPSGGDVVSHVLLASKEDAEEALRKIQAGQRTFEDVASGPENMDRAAAAKEGKVEGQIMIPSIREAIEKARAGEVYPEVVESPVGWHVLKVGAKEAPKKVTFESVRGQIEQKLLVEKQREAERWWIEELRNRADIETYMEGAGGLGGLQSMLGGLQG